MSSSRSSSRALVVGQPAKRRTDVLADRHTAPDEDVLERRVSGESVDLGAERARVDVLAADGSGDDLGEGGGERGDGAGGTDLERAADERLVADEDIEALEQISLELLPRAVRDLHPGEVRGPLAEALDDGGRDCVAARDRELVDVEGERRAGGGGSGEVLELRGLVEREVRRGDHGDRVRTRLGGVGGEDNGVGGRLRPGVDCDLEAPGARLEKELDRPLPLRDREQDPLAVRPEGEQAVEAAGVEEVRDGAESVLVDGCAAVAKRRDRGG